MTQPISVIAKSLVRERLRTGLSLAEIARRADRQIHAFTTESGNGNPSLKRCGRFAWRWIFRLPGYWSRSNPSRR